MPTGELFAFITALCWTTSATMFSEASKRIGSIQLNINRLIIGFVLLTVLIFIAGFSFRVSNTQLLLLSFSGFIGLIFGDSFLFQAYTLIGARLTMLMMSIAPGFAVLLSNIFLGESLHGLHLVGIVITLGGVAAVVYFGEEKTGVAEKHYLTGLLFGLLAALGQAGGLVTAKLAFKLGEVHPFVATLVRIGVSTFLFFPVLLLLGRYKNPLILYSGKKWALWFTIGGAVFGPVLGITSSLIAIQHTQIGIASTIMAIVPVLMIPVSYIVYKEHIKPVAIIGAVVAVFGVAVLTLA